MFQWGFLAGLIAFALVPLPTAGLSPDPTPSLSYESALAAYDELVREERELPLHTACRSRLLSRGTRTEKVVVLVHGITNCPSQFDELGRQLFELGHNVLIPRLPLHGYASRDAAELLPLKAEDYRAYADRAVDVAHGLGQRTVVFGLSAGANAAAWMAQFRPEVDRAVLLAPALGVSFVPADLTFPVMNFFGRLPSFFTSNPNADAHTYPGVPTRAVVETLRLGSAVYRAAKRAVPLARSIALVTVPDDQTVNNGMARRLAQRWAARGGLIETHAFPPAWELTHDPIDTDQPGQPIGLTYPFLIDLMLERPASAR